MEPASHDRWEKVAAQFQIKPSTLISMVIARAEADPRILQLAIVEPLMSVVVQPTNPGGIGQVAPTLVEIAPTHPLVHRSTDPPIHVPTRSAGADRQVEPSPDEAQTAAVSDDPTASKPGPVEPAIGPQRVTTSLKAGKLNRPQEAAFLAWWEVVPRKRAKGHARRSYAKALANGVTPERLADRMAAYAQAVTDERREPSKIKHPATWLNAECWDDEDTASTTVAAAQTKDRDRNLAELEAKHNHLEGVIRESGPRPDLVERLNRYRERLGWDPKQFGEWKPPDGGGSAIEQLKRLAQ